jgi:hypothetical protein
MAGPWHVEILAESDHDTLTAQTPIEVGFEALPSPAGDGAPAAVLDMSAPAPGTPIDPWWIVAITILLVVMFETIAIARKLGASRGPGRTARADDGRLSSPEGLQP